MLQKKKKRKQKHEYFLFSFQRKQNARGVYRSYDSDELNRAFEAVIDNDMSIRKASQSFGVPKSTLMDRLHGRVSLDVVKSGPLPLFSDEQEALLTGHLKTMAEVGYGYSRQETINLASDYAIFLGLRDKHHPLTDRWLYNFLDRWPELKVKKPRSLEIARARSATRQAVDSYFNELQRILTKYNLTDKPQCIYNVDEKGLQAEHKPPKIVSGKNYKAQAVTSGKSKNTTVIGCVNGVGQQVPPYFVFPGSRMLDSLMEGATPGATGTVSETGWSNTEIFEDYKKNHLINYIPSRDSDYVLILYDGHKSHVSLGLIEWAKSQNIILFVLPPHCSHLLQPLDVSCFGPFEVAWNSACHRHIRESGGQLVTRYDVCRLACKIYTTTLTANNILSAFKRCGIIPFNPHVVSDPMVAPANTFSQGQECITPVRPLSESAENFLLHKGGQILANVQTAKKKRNTLSKVVGGKAITEDEVMDKIVEHQDKNKPKIKSRTGKSKQTIYINEVIPKKSKISTNSTSPVAGPSGVPLKKMKKVQIESCDSDSEEDIPDYEKCIICKRSSPDFSKKPFIIIVNWGQCEKCNGWVHLSFCTKVRVLRRGDTFLCPICEPITPCQ